MAVGSFQSKYQTRDGSALNEATRTPIFLFQRKVWALVNVPNGYDVDDEGDVVPEGWEKRDERGDALSWETLAETTKGEWDAPCAISHWETERVYLTREEGERYGEGRAYNYPDGWRVYSVCAKGELAEALKDGTEHPKSAALAAVREARRGK